MVFKAIPYTFYEPGTTYFWVHFGLVIFGFLFAVATLIGQWVKPAPYGKHEREDPNWGPLIPQRLSHIISDAISGVFMFSLVFFLYSREESDKDVVNYVFYGLFMVHTIHRGIIHPLVMKYRSAKVPLGILLGGFIPNILYQWLIANHIGVAHYYHSYPYDPRFISGLILYVLGFVTNRWADWKLRSLRKKKGAGDSSTSIIEGKSNGSKGYYIPNGGLFELISCPNYFGELVQWVGWMVATWSLSGFVWLCFCAATFFARSRHNHNWYKEHFEDYPAKRKALIPFIL